MKSGVLKGVTVLIGATTLAGCGLSGAAAQTELDAETLADVAAVQVRYPCPN